MKHDVPYGFWFFLFGLLLIFVAILGSFQKVPTGEAVTAMYTRGVLRVTIPYQVPRAGAGQLMAEVLDPEDAVLGRVALTLDRSNHEATAGRKLTFELEDPRGNKLLPVATSRTVLTRTSWRWRLFPAVDRNTRE